MGLPLHLQLCRSILASLRAGTQHMPSTICIRNSFTELLFLPGLKIVQVDVIQQPFLKDLS
jgi:hypothetical protein